jgi:hypothetical protein
MSVMAAAVVLGQLGGGRPARANERRAVAQPFAANEHRSLLRAGDLVTVAFEGDGRTNLDCVTQSDHACMITVPWMECYPLEGCDSMLQECNARMRG